MFVVVVTVVVAVVAVDNVSFVAAVSLLCAVVVVVVVADVKWPLTNGRDRKYAIFILARSKVTCDTRLVKCCPSDN